MKRRYLVPLICVAIGLLCANSLEAQNGFKLDPVSSGVKAAIYGGMAAAAGIVVVVTYLVLRKPSITGCTMNDGKGLAIQPEGKNTAYLLTGETAQLKAGEHVRVSGTKNKKEHTFSVRKVSKNFGACHEATAAPE